MNLYTGGDSITIISKESGTLGRSLITADRGWLSDRLSGKSTQGLQDRDWTGHEQQEASVQKGELLIGVAYDVRIPSRREAYHTCLFVCLPINLNWSL